MAGAVVGTAGVVAAAGIVELGQMTKNYAQGKYVDTATGQKININSPEGRAAYDANPKGFSVEGGTPRAIAKNVLNNFRSGAKSVSDSALESMGAERINNPENGTTNSGYHTDNQNPNTSGEGKPNNVSHGEPPSNNLPNYIKNGDINQILSVEGGTPRKFVQNMFQKGDLDFGGKSPINSVDSPSDIPNTPENRNPNPSGEGKPNNVSHGESPSNNLPNYIKNGDINQILQMDSSDIAKDSLKSQINEKIGQLDVTDAKYLEQKSGFDSLMSKIG